MVINHFALLVDFALPMIVLKRAEYVNAFVWLPYPFQERKIAYVSTC